MTQRYDLSVRNFEKKQEKIGLFEAVQRFRADSDVSIAFFKKKIKGLP